MPDNFDDWLRANAHRKPPQLDDLDRPPTPTATTNDRPTITTRLHAEWAATTTDHDTESETP